MGQTFVNGVCMWYKTMLGFFRNGAAYSSSCNNGCTFLCVSDTVPGIMAETLTSLSIANCLGCEGVERWARAERFEHWQHRMHRLGFQAVPFSHEALSEGCEVISEAKGRSSCAAFKVESVEGAIKLRWRGTPLISVGAWR